MTHLTSLQISMYADGAFPAGTSDFETAQQHVVECNVCQAKITAAQLERTLLMDALDNDPSTVSSDLVIPTFKRPTSLRNFAMANIATGLVIWMAGFLWKTLFGELTINALSWLTSTYLPDVYTMTSATALYFLKEGTAMINSYLGFVVLMFSALTALGLLLIYRKHRASAGLCLAAVLSASMLAPTPTHALEVMRDEEGVITIAADETIDDTLIVAAERVIVKGNVTGDLLVVGQQVDVTGTVGGNLWAFGEQVTISGQVAGMTLGASSTFNVRGASLGGDLWAAGAKVSVDEQSSVANNGNVAAENVSIEGTIGKDLHTFAESTELSGTLGQDLEAFGANVRLMDTAHVTGNARLRVGSEDHLYREEGARVDGEVTFLDLPEEFEPRSRYATLEFYLWKLAHLVSAVLVGLALLWLIPSLTNTSINGAMNGLKLAGVGIIALVSVPIIAVLIAITIVGIPFSVVALFAWMLGIYLSQILIGVFIGRMIFSDSKFETNWVMIMIAGMASVIVVINLPAIGGAIGFVLTIVGLGLITTSVYDALSNRGETIAA